jgi:hypothetical protein
MYDINSVSISFMLLISMVAAIEMGYRIGLNRQTVTNEASKIHLNSIQSSIIGILALLLGFTFSLSLQRYDSRSEAVVEEANAIGTTYLRAQLLPADIRNDVQVLLRQYVDLRIQESKISLLDYPTRKELLDKTTDMQSTLWSFAKRAVEIDPNLVKTGLFIQSLNDVIDNFGKRNATINRHVPELILVLLYGTFILAGVILGFTSGVTANRPSIVSYFMVILIVILVYIILDLDRPRRGLIVVSQAPLIELQSSFTLPK